MTRGVVPLMVLLAISAGTAASKISSARHRSGDHRSIVKMLAGVRHDLTERRVQSGVDLRAGDKIWRINTLDMKGFRAFVIAPRDAEAARGCAAAVAAAYAIGGGRALDGVPAVSRNAVKGHTLATGHIAPPISFRAMRLRPKKYARIDPD